MASLIDSSAQAIADALAPSAQAPSARWRWGTVVSVSSSGTMNVSVAGATLPGVRCAQHVMGAQVGDRVRVMYCGTEAVIDAVRAASDLITLPNVTITGTLTVPNAPNGSYGARQDISSYASSSNRYTFPSDGLLQISTSYRASAWTRAHIYDADGNQVFEIQDSATSGSIMVGNMMQTAPVFKGMSAYMEYNTSVGYSGMYFIPIATGRW